MRIDPSNVDQLRAWDGERGAFWAERADRYDEGVAAYRFPTAAGIEPGETVLDVGCGNGRTTREAARQASGGTALGVDLSTRMIALARSRATRDGVANASFEQADAQVHPFPDAHFDVVISRHGAMFFGDPPAAFANLARSTRPGGRLVLLSWQPRQPWGTAFLTALTGSEPAAAATSPGDLRDPDQTRDLLTTAGFTDVRVCDERAPMYFGTDADDAFRFLTGQFAAQLAGLAEADRPRALAALRATLADHESDAGVYYDSAAWLIEARR
jgi:ubiquinone/menaquinone biosynthesis C-methylase UbiE